MSHQKPPHQSAFLVQTSIRSFLQSKQPPALALTSEGSQRSKDEETRSSLQDLPTQAATPNSPTTADPITSSLAPSMPTHHHNVSISPILPSYIRPSRHIVSRVFPVRYSNSFYAALSNPESSGAFSRVLLWTDYHSTSKPKVIGGLICRLEHMFYARPNSACDMIPNALHIQSLVLNEAYRWLGLATELLDYVCRLAQ